jgi:cystine transport system substrate-binding protein
MLSFAAVALAVLAAPTVSGAIPQHGTSALRAHDAVLAAKSRAAVLNLYSIDQHLSAARAELGSLQAQQQSLRAERAVVEQQLSIAKRGTRLAQARLGERLRLLYEQGSVEPLDIVFGAKSLDEALSNLENLSRVTGQGEDILRELKAARTSADAAARTLAAKEAALDRAMRQAQATAASLAGQRAARSAYIAALADQRRMTQRHIANVIAEADAARLRSEQLAQTAAADTVASHVPDVPGTGFAAPSGRTTAATARTLTVSATGYSLTGRTATGLPVGWGVVAVDPSVIPLGTHMTIPGYGEAVAADTGGAVMGSSIDLWFPTLDQANAWGRRTVTISLH